MIISSETKQRFYNSVEVTDLDSCHIWTRGDRFQYKNKIYTPQQFAWIMYVGDVPNQHVIKPFCGNKNCVRVSHLIPVYIGDIYKSKLSVEDRFLSHVNKTDSCWEWKASSGEGYGFFYVNGKKVKAHRFSYQLYKGEIPDGLLVCHKCDNPRCVNPSHLFLGSNHDNQMDAVRKGRNNPPRGERAYNNKLKEDEIVHIRNLRDLGWTLQNIGNLYGIGFQYVSKIVNRKVWKHLP